MVWVMGKRLVDLYNNLHIRGKMLLTFLVFGFIPLLFVSFFQLNAVIRVLQAQLEDMASNSLHVAAQRLNEKFDTYNRIANTIVYDPYLLHFLSSSYPRFNEAVEPYHYVWNQANSIIADNPDIRRISVYTDHSDLITMAPYLVNLDDLNALDQYDWLRTSYVSPYISGLRFVRPRKDYWTSAAQDGERMVSLNRVISQHAVYRQPMGILTMSISEESLRSLINAASDQSVTFIVDQFNTIVTATNLDVIGAPVGSLVAGDLWNAASPSENATDIGNGQKLLVHKLQCGWVLATVLSTRDLQASVGNIRYIGFALISMCGVASVVLVSLLSNVTARRFKVLLNKMRASKQHFPEPGPPIDGKDEIGLLDEGFREMASNLDDAIHELYQVEFEKRKAQMLALQSKINPHFLYNTLSSIGWMTRTHTPAQVREAIETLAFYYRSILSGGRDVITLEEELKGLRSYLAIQHLRGSGRVRSVISMDSALYRVPIPKMTLQPIVENSIEHGINLESESSSIFITSSLDENDVLIHVFDDGPGVDAETLEQLRNGARRLSGRGYGLYNVQTRLKLHFGEKYGLEIENLPESGLKVSVRLPMPQENE